LIRITFLRSTNASKESKEHRYRSIGENKHCAGGIFTSTSSRLDKTLIVVLYLGGKFRVNVSGRIVRVRTAARKSGARRAKGTKNRVRAPPTKLRHTPAPSIALIPWVIVVVLCGFAPAPFSQQKNGLPPSLRWPLADFAVAPAEYDHVGVANGRPDASITAAASFRNP
jgi:hypothetical protein